jgi:ABC-type Mn2+/Zn2+ transport system ATPase subunit
MPAAKRKTRKRRRDALAPVVVMDNAARSFGDRIILSGLNLEVSAGQMVGIVGPNGGGKSTSACSGGQ